MGIGLELDIIANAVCMKCGREGELDAIKAKVERLLETGESAVVSAQTACVCGCKNWRLNLGAEPAD